MPVKKVLVDLCKLKQLACGLGQMSLQMGHYLDGYKDDDIEIHLLIPKEWQGYFKGPVEVLSEKRRYFPKLAKHYDLWHATHQDSDYMPSSKGKFLLTIADLNFLSEKKPAKARLRLRRVQKKVNRADALTTISEFTAGDVKEHLDTRQLPVSVVPLGVDVSEQLKKPSQAGDGAFLFSIGVMAAKKNFHVLLPMMKYLPQYKLYIAGKGGTDYESFLNQQIHELGLQDQVKLLGVVTDEERSWLYRNCSGFVFPSLLEGFGMPVIEAMRFGSPVIANRGTSLPEFGGSHAAYFDTFEPELMASVVREKVELHSEGDSEGCAEWSKQFNWQATGGAYLKLYKQLLAE